MLVGRMIDDELGEHSQLSPPCLLYEATEIRHRAEIGIDRAVVRNVIAVVTAGRGIERLQPKRGDAEVLQVVEFFGQPYEIADAVVVAVGECLDMKLIDDRVLEPKLVAFEPRRRPDVGDHIHGTAFTRSREQQGGILLLIDTQTDTAPLEDVPFAGDQIFNGFDAPARGRWADLDIAEMKPELAWPGLCQRHGDGYRII